MSVYKSLIKKLTDIFHKKKSSNVGKLLLLASDQIEKINDTMAVMELWRDIDEAKGYHLDRIGAEFVQEYRNCQNDEDYRLRIKVKAVAMASKGDIETLNLVMRLYFGDSFVSVQEAWSHPDPYVPQLPARVLITVKDHNPFPAGVIGRVIAAGVSYAFRTIKQDEAINERTRTFKVQTNAHSFLGFRGDMQLVRLDGSYFLNNSFRLNGKSEYEIHEKVKKHLQAKFTMVNLFAPFSTLTSKQENKAFHTKSEQRASVAKSRAGFLGFIPVALNGQHILDGSWYLNGAVEKNPRLPFAHQSIYLFGLKKGVVNYSSVKNHIKNQNQAQSKNVQVLRSRASLRGPITIYLDGSEQLSEDWYLNGYNHQHLLIYKQIKTYKTVVRMPLINEGLTIKRTSWWSLNGDTNLEGSKLLAAKAEILAM